MNKPKRCKYPNHGCKIEVHTQTDCDACSYYRVSNKTIDPNILFKIHNLKTTPTI